MTEWRMPRIYGMMVTYNEADRWLESVVKHAMTCVDGLFVYDDRSSDETVEICEHYGATTRVRPLGETPFMQNEGTFRRDAWLNFSLMMDVRPDDWILALDADEFLMAYPAGNSRICLETAIERARTEGVGAINVEFKEIWGTNPLVYRTDGFWDTIKHPRLFRYEYQTDWNTSDMGGGSWPSYVKQNGAIDSLNLRMLHFGYAREEDRRSKYERYTKNAGLHSNKHIRSIITEPTLEEWTGETPCL